MTAGPGSALSSRRRCGLIACAEPVAEVVTHPGRAEERTRVCQYHLRRAREAGARVLEEASARVET